MAELYETDQCVELFPNSHVKVMKITFFLSFPQRKHFVTALWACNCTSIWTRRVFKGIFREDLSSEVCETAHFSWITDYSLTKCWGFFKVVICRAIGVHAPPLLCESQREQRQQEKIVHRTNCRVHTFTRRVLEDQKMKIFENHRTKE